MNTAGFADRWDGKFRPSADGNFSTNVVLKRNGGGTQWDFLKDGETDLLVSHDYIAGMGGRVTVAPYVKITNISLLINGTPLPRFTSMGADGTLSWSTLPTRGHLELFGAESLTNSWQPVAVFTNQETTFTPAITNKQYFYRSIWVSE